MNCNCWRSTLKRESMTHFNLMKTHFISLQQISLLFCSFYRIISEARSYGETMVQPQTKTLSPTTFSQSTSIYDKPSSTILMDEVDTMAERDLGSTFLLPHTHLYKPDRVWSKYAKCTRQVAFFQVIEHFC